MKIYVIYYVSAKGAVEHMEIEFSGTEAEITAARGKLWTNRDSITKNIHRDLDSSVNDGKNVTVMDPAISPIEKRGRGMLSFRSQASFVVNLSFKTVPANQAIASQKQVRSSCVASLLNILGITKPPSIAYRKINSQPIAKETERSKADYIWQSDREKETFEVILSDNVTKRLAQIRYELPLLEANKQELADEIEAARARGISRSSRASSV